MESEEGMDDDTWRDIQLSRMEDEFEYKEIMRGMEEMRRESAMLGRTT